jgi:hypothetical protein
MMYASVRTSRLGSGRVFPLTGTVIKIYSSQSLNSLDCDIVDSARYNSSHNHYNERNCFTRLVELVGEDDGTDQSWCLHDAVFILEIGEDVSGERLFQWIRLVTHRQ